MTIADAHRTALAQLLIAAADDINCLAYYGITKGTSATTFDPDSNVTRGQMALFLYRTAKAAGIDLMGGDMDAMYTDIDELRALTSPPQRPR